MSDRSRPFPPSIEQPPTVSSRTNTHQHPVPPQLLYRTSASLARASYRFDSSPTSPCRARAAALRAVSVVNHLLVCSSRSSSLLWMPCPPTLPPARRFRNLLRASPQVIILADASGCSRPVEAIEGSRTLARPQDEYASSLTLAASDIDQRPEMTSVVLPCPSLERLPSRSACHLFPLYPNTHLNLLDCKQQSKPDFSPLL